MAFAPILLIPTRSHSMRKSLLIFLFGIAAGAAAQDAAKPPAPPPAPAQELDKDTQTRIRAERFAGGLGNITPEEKANANVGAGPHTHARPDGPAKREPREESVEREAGRGASR
jgi:hypothetical protein